MCDLFSNNQQSQQQQNASQTGQSSTQSNIWGQLQPFLQDYMQQYASGNIGATGTPNAAQTTAANNQTTNASGANLAPGQTAASNIATNGLTPSSISQYMSPYISSVVNPTLQAQNIQNQQALSNLAGSQASRGALGNNTGSQAAYLAAVQPSQEAAIGNLYNSGYNTAANTALSSGQLQLSGANALGNLTNVGTNANSALGSLGNSLYQTSLTPYTLYNQGVSGLSGLGGLSGSNTSSSGTSTGTSNGTTTSNPSLGSILLGGLGTIMSGFKEGGSVHEMEPFHPHDDMATKVAKGVRAIHKLRKEMGGGVPRYDDGGMVPFATAGVPMMTPFSDSTSPATPQIGPWQTTVTPASSGFQMKPFNTENAGKSLTNFAGQLGSFGMPHYDDGGSVPTSAPLSPAATTPASSSGDWSSYLPSYSSGVWAGQAPDRWQRMGAALTQIGNGPFAGFGNSILEQQQLRYKDLEAQRAAQQLGMEAKRLGMEEELQPSRVSEAKSDALIKAHEADMNYQLNRMKAKGATDNEIALARAQMMAKFADSLSPEQQGNVDRTFGTNGLSVAPTTPTSEDDYNALPSGSIYTDPNGQTRRKP